MKMDAAYSAESLVHIYQNTRHHMKVDSHENLKYKENSLHDSKRREMNTYASGRIPINTNRKTVPFVVGFLPQRSRFSPTAAYVECVMDSVAVGKVFL
jgi:hypothetical protein